MLRLLQPFALGLALIAASAVAAPLTFGGINGTDDLSGSAELAGCRQTTDEMRRCQLARQTFGGLDIASSEALLNGAGRVRSLRITVDRADFDLARQMLIGRYGAASNWTGFDGGARIGIARTPDAAVISFDFPSNAAAGARLDMRAVWTVLSLLALGLALGWYLFRGRRTRRARRPEPEARAPLSMRDTLERRVREGGELRF